MHLHNSVLFVRAAIKRLFYVFTCRLQREYLLSYIINLYAHSCTTHSGCTKAVRMPQTINVFFEPFY